MATATTTGLELDPIFVRALRLLHSRSKDSANQLRAMVDDCLRQVNTVETRKKLQGI
jgi:hypothetical protein